MISPSDLAAAVAPLAAAPERSAVFLDLDGTLAPIAPRPEQAAVPARTLGLIELIAQRYAATGIVSGRAAADARSILGLEGISYVGNHGFELLEPGAVEAVPAPALAGHEREAAEFASGLDAGLLEAAGIRLEDKGPIQALHWRGAEDERKAERIAAEAGALAEATGLALHAGRKVLELRPAVSIDKGVGLAALLERLPVDQAFYAGDDRTDADAFRQLAAMVADGRLEGALRVVVLADETPPEVADAADIAVDGTEGFVTVLEALA